MLCSKGAFGSQRGKGKGLRNGNKENGKANKENEISLASKYSSLLVTAMLLRPMIRIIDYCDYLAY